MRLRGPLVAVFVLIVAAVIPAGTMAADSTEFVCKKKKHQIVIDMVSEGTYRYRAWNVSRSASLPPNMQVQQINAFAVEGTGVGRYAIYTFKKGNVEYRVEKDLGCTESDPPADATGRLFVLIDGVERGVSWCYERQPACGRDP